MKYINLEHLSTSSIVLLALQATKGEKSEGEEKRYAWQAYYLESAKTWWLEETDALQYLF